MVVLLQRLPIIVSTRSRKSPLSGRQLKVNLFGSLDKPGKKDKTDFLRIILRLDNSRLTKSIKETYSCSYKTDSIFYPFLWTDHSLCKTPALRKGVFARARSDQYSALFKNAAQSESRVSSRDQMDQSPIDISTLSLV